MSDDGDQHLRDAGIVLPCAKQFGYVGFSAGSSILFRCDRPYGHSGPHTKTDEAGFASSRDAEDDARTINVLSLILKAP